MNTNKDKTKIKRKSVNYFSKKIEYWKCSDFYHQLIITKYHGIVCKKCYQNLHNDAKKTFFYFVSALEIEFDTLLEEETKSLEDMFETMHNFWKSYVVETNFDLNDFENCYLEEVKVVKEAYEMLETYNVYIRNKSLDEETNLIESKLAFIGIVGVLE